MVTRTLCATIMITYICYEQITTYYQTGNVFGYATKEKPELCVFLFFQLSRHTLHLDAPTSEINGREAFMWYHYDEIHILRTNYHILPNCNVFGYASKENPELCVFWFSSVRGTCCIHMPDSWASRCPNPAIIGHEAYMWYHYDYIHIFGTNYHVLPDW